MTEQVDLVPTSLAVMAMRDNGYRNTSYAIAELIDNAVQARATSVQLLCCERQSFVRERTRRNIHHVAILDNGIGMDADVLQAALQFGNGKYLKDRSGIGRFGMGLPSSSISQCRKVEVWTWQEGLDNALYSYIDLNDVESDTQTGVPYPIRREVPDMWQTAGRSFAQSGTLVVWSELDRCLWKTASTIIRNSEYLIGRMYRRFVNKGELSIRMASFVEDTPSTFDIERFASTNDPLYRMIPSSTPKPYNEESMFQEDGDRWEIPHDIEYNADTHRVMVRFTVAKEEARNRTNAGSTPYGKHAKGNIGVSLIRADRELELETSLVVQYDPRERWWGVEVEFPPSLDEIFGVTNNKQAARHFTETARTLQNDLAEAESIAERKNQMSEDNDPRGPLIDVVHLIDRRLRGLRKIIEIQRKNTGKKRRHDPDSAEGQATEVTRSRQVKGHRGISDEGEVLPKEERTAALAQDLEEGGLSGEQAKELAARTIDQGIKYTFTVADLEGRTFFTVKPVAGEIVIKLNTNHPAYSNLMEVLEDDPDSELTNEQLLERLSKANRGLKLLLMAWARFEDEAFPEEKREEIQDVRHEWGRYAAQFLKNE